MVQTQEISRVVCSALVKLDWFKWWMRRRWHDDEVGLYSGCSLVIGCSEWLVWRDVATETWNHLFSKNKALSRFRATWWWNMETMKQIIHMFSYSTLPLHNYRMEWNHCAGGTLNWTSCGCVCWRKCRRQQIVCFTLSDLLHIFW